MRGQPVRLNRDRRVPRKRRVAGSGRLQLQLATRDDPQIVRDDGRPDVGPEVFQPAPVAAAEAEAALEVRDHGLHAGPEVPQPPVDPWGRGHVRGLEALLLVEDHVVHSQSLRLGQIGLAGVAPVTRHLLRHRPVDRGVPFDHRQTARAVRRIARLDHGIEHQTARTAAQVHLVSVLNPAPALADDVGVGLEQAHHLLLRGDRLALQHPANRLADDRPGQFAVVDNLRAPVLDPRLVAALDRLQGAIGLPKRSPHDRQQLAVQLDLTLHPRLGDLPLLPLRRPAVVVEGEGIGSQLLPAPGQQPGQHAHRVVQQLAVARIQDMRLGHGAVDAYLAARFELVVAGPAQQDPVDPLPYLGPNGPDATLQRRALRGPQRIDACEAPRRDGVDQGELQFPVVRLPQMLQDPAAQDHLARQPAPPNGRHNPAVNIRGDPLQELRVFVQKPRHQGQHPPHVVIRISGIEKTPLRCPFCTHRQLPLASAQPLSDG